MFGAFFLLLQVLVVIVRNKVSFFYAPSNHGIYVLIFSLFFSHSFDFFLFKRNLNRNLKGGFCMNHSVQDFVNGFLSFWKTVIYSLISQSAWILFLSRLISIQSVPWIKEIYYSHHVDFILLFFTWILYSKISLNYESWQFCTTLRVSIKHFALIIVCVKLPQLGNRKIQTHRIFLWDKRSIVTSNNDIGKW